MLVSAAFQMFVLLALTPYFSPTIDDIVYIIPGVLYYFSLPPA